MNVISSCCGQNNIILSSETTKQRAFYGRSQVLAIQVHSRPRNSTNSKKVSKIKAFWRAGEVTKPEYVRLCNQIHLLDLQDRGPRMGRKLGRQSKTSWRTSLEAKQRTKHKTDQYWEWLIFWVRPPKIPFFSRPDTERLSMKRATVLGQSEDFLKLMYYCSYAFELQSQHVLSPLILIPAVRQPNIQKSTIFACFGTIFSQMVEAPWISG